MPSDDSRVCTSTHDVVGVLNHTACIILMRKKTNWCSQNINPAAEGGTAKDGPTAAEFEDSERLARLHSSTSF
jgi:hypothetical protein